MSLERVFGGVKVGLIVASLATASAFAKANRGTDVGVIDSAGYMTLFFREGSEIVVRKCDKDSGAILLGERKREDCKTVGAENRVPVQVFKQAIKDALKAPEGSDSSLQNAERRKKDIQERLAVIQFFFDNNAGDAGAEKDRARLNAKLKQVQEEIKTARESQTSIREINRLVDRLVDQQISQESLNYLIPGLNVSQPLYAALKQFDGSVGQCGVADGGSPGDSKKPPVKKGLKETFFDVFQASTAYADPARIERMIQDCAKMPGSSVVHKKSGVKWNLVSRALDSKTGKFREVWLDSKSGLLWGDRLEREESFYNAVEVSSACQTIDVDQSKNCKVVQEKACGSAEAKQANGEIEERKFALPQIQEFQEAFHHGISEVLPNMDRSYWSSSQDSKIGGQALMYSKEGVGIAKKESKFSIRCVGRVM